MNHAELFTRAQQFQAEVGTPITLTPIGSGPGGYGMSDSDMDLAGVHLEPVSRYLSMLQSRQARTRIHHDWDQDGALIDFTSIDLKTILIGIQQGSGSLLEMILSPNTVQAGPVPLEDLVKWAKRVLSRQFANHYRGMAKSGLSVPDQSSLQIRAGAYPVKTILASIRSCLIGTHLLTTGELVVSLPQLAHLYQVEVQSLLDTRAKSGRQATLEAPYDLSKPFRLLQMAYEDSPLPPGVEDQVRIDLDDWFVQLRLDLGRP